MLGFAVSLLIISTKLHNLNSFIIRSIYTGSLFKFLQADDHEKEPQTIEEMTLKNYKFYLIPSYVSLTDETANMRGK